MKVEPNPPIWPDSVKVLRPGDPNIEAVMKETEDNLDEHNRCYSCDHHFSSRRIALLFAPGTYDIKFQVGYYVQALGLGRHPNQVVFENGSGPFVPALNKHLSQHGSSLDTFWRSAENFSTTSDMQWAVSQAAPLRRVHVGGDLSLYDRQAYASGGFMANCRIDGRTDFGGQQQWICRNCHFGSEVEGGAWSLVFCSCSGQVPPQRIGTISSPSVSVESEIPIQMEKPYIAMAKDGFRYELRVPRASRDCTLGSGHNSADEEDVRDFSYVFVAMANEDDVNTKIQSALDDGKDVILAAGIFELQFSLKVKYDNQVILGIGLSTLQGPSDGSPCIHVPPNLTGVRVAGIMLEAPLRSTAYGFENSSLLEWGDFLIHDEGDLSNPGGLFDVFCRVGGADTSGDRSQYFVDSIIRIHSGNVVGDNLWLWRADHSQLRNGELPNFAPIPTYHQTEEDEYRVKNGIHVLGDDVTIYGLAVEHMIEHQTLWSGDRGKVYFYQCELPYGVRQSSFGDRAFVGYKVADNVFEHILVAPGVYSNFRNERVDVYTAILVPEREAIRIVNPFIVHLDNNGYIRSIVNGKGGPALVKGNPVWL